MAPVQGDDDGRPLNPIILAADTNDPQVALGLIQQLGQHIGLVKVGLEYFISTGADGYTELASKIPVFLDLKLHDIANTMSRSVLEACRVGSRAGCPAPHMLTIHALAGRRGVEAATTARNHHYGDTGQYVDIVAVTILSSLDDDDLAEMHIGQPDDMTLWLAEMSLNAGVDGIVCAPTEIVDVRSNLGDDFIIVAPGIRQSFDNRDDDQRRTGTIRPTLDSGASYVVVGRAITNTEDPVAALRELLR